MEPGCEFCHGQSSHSLLPIVFEQSILSPHGYGPPRTQSSEFESLNATILKWGQNSSALGQKATCRDRRQMSAFPPKTDNPRFMSTRPRPKVWDGVCALTA